MSSHEEKEFWLDTYWPALVITFGVLFITSLIVFHPVQ